MSIKGQYFQFIDVPGDGDCFFHSILKSEYLSGFSSVHELTMYLGSRIEVNYTNDIFLQRIFTFHRMDVVTWLNRIRTMGTWANELDMLLTAYILHINIISVANYMHGIICNDMQYNLNLILQSNSHHITENSTIYVYFHIFQNPISRMFDGNHFGFMHPIQYLPEENNTSHLNSSIDSDLQINKVPSLINKNLTKDFEDSSGCVFEDTQNTVSDLCDTIDRKRPLNKCLNVINRTHTSNSTQSMYLCYL